MNAFVLRYSRALLAPLLLPLLVHGGSLVGAGYPVLEQAAETLEVSMRISSNGFGGACEPVIGAPPVSPYCFLGSVQLRAPRGLPASGWALYFSIAQRITQVSSGPFVIAPVNGSLYKLSPTDAFKGLAPGAVVSAEFSGSGLMLNRAQFMPNAFLVDPKGNAYTVASTRPEPDRLTGLRRLPFVAPMGHQARTLRDSYAQSRSRPPLAAQLFERYKAGWTAGEVLETEMVPKPLRVSLAGAPKRRVDLSGGVALSVDPQLLPQLQAALDRVELPHSDQGIALSIRLKIAGSMPEEAYHLRTRPGRIDITARGAAGAAYALTTLAALKTPGRSDIPAVDIEDAPYYAYRGQHLDVARNFLPKSFTLALIEQMARYKLNRLTLHLTDDEGWRLQIHGLPELTEIGARRCFEVEQGNCLLPQLGSGVRGTGTGANGFYSEEDYKEMLKFAAARHIEVIPAIDVPGHARAAIQSMESRYRRMMRQDRPLAAQELRLIDPDNTTVYRSVQGFDDNTVNPCISSTYAFLDKVLGEVIRMHAEAGVPLQRFVLGGDEAPAAWTESPACARFLSSETGKAVGSVDNLQAYFVERVANMIAAKGVIPVAWNDGLQQTRPDKMPRRVQSNIWAAISTDGANIAFDQSNLGWDVVFTTYEALYFDAPYTTAPYESGNFWTYPAVDAERIFKFMPQNIAAHAEIWTNGFDQDFNIEDPGTDAAPGKLFGIQGQLWTEMIRDQTLAQHMLFPRMLALAERAWHAPNWAPPRLAGDFVYKHGSGTLTPERLSARDRDWRRFARLLGMKELPRLRESGIAFRLPLPGAVIHDGRLRAKVPYPWVGIEYREAGGNWKPYQGPVSVRGPVELRSFDLSDGRRGQILAAGA